MERMCTNVRSLADTPDTHMQIHHETNVYSLTCRYTTRRMFALLHADTPRDDVRSLTCRYTTRRCSLSYMQIHHETMFALLHADTPRDECVTLHADTPRDECVILHADTPRDD